MLLPEGASTIAPQVDRLFWIILWITGGFFFLVQGCLLLFVLLYRDQPGRKASYLHGSTAVEVIWTIVPALILLWLTLASQKVWADIRFPKAMGEPVSMQVEIIAEQFAWNVRYPGPDGVFGTPDDVTTINQLHLPLGEAVLVRLNSKDVIHSFFVAEFRVKQDAVPGLTTQVRLTATREGEYEIRCAELCGLGHYRMRGFVTTQSRPELEKWLAQTKANE